MSPSRSPRESLDAISSIIVDLPSPPDPANTVIVPSGIMLGINHRCLRGVISLARLIFAYRPDCRSGGGTGGNSATVILLPFEARTTGPLGFKITESWESAAAFLRCSRANTSLASDALHAAQNRRELRSPSGAPATNARRPLRAVSDDTGRGVTPLAMRRIFTAAVGVRCDTGRVSARYGSPVNG